MKILEEILILGVLFVLMVFSTAVAQNFQFDKIKTTVVFNKDATFTQDTLIEATILAPAGIFELQTVTQEFFLDSQSLEVDAYVIQPDGEKILVPLSNITIEKSLSSQDDSGFTNSRTMHVLLPQLRVGSRIYVTWKMKQKKPFPIGYSSVWSPPFYQGVKDFQVHLTLPKDLKFDWSQRGGFKVQDSLREDTRVIEARFENAPGNPYEKSMPNSLDFAPIFVVSAFLSWKDYSSKCYESDMTKSEVTPRIQELSNKIVENKKGKEAAEAIYNWVAENIHYVAVYLNLYQEFIPHSAEEILKNGYGDCKDHVTLMQALLKAQEIASFRVLVNWGNLYNPMLLANQNQFNHMMIYLPDFNIFANPTNPFAPFGGMGQGLDGKFVLISTPDGKTAHLPMPKPQHNIYHNKMSLEILADGSVKGSNTITSTGNMETLVRYALSDFFSENESLEERAQSILSQDTTGGEGRFTLSTSPYDLSHPFVVKGSWMTPKSFSFENKEGFFWTPEGLEIINPHALRAQISSEKRLYPFVSNYFPLPDSMPQYLYTGQYIWSYEIKIPQNYKLQNVPSNISYATPQGSYKSTYSTKGDIFFIKRILTINNSYLSAQEYEELFPILYKFENDVNAIFLVKKK